MIRKISNKLVSGMMAAWLLIVTGCAAVGGVDVKQAMVNQFKVTSSESNMSVTLELTADSNASAEQKAALEALGSISIHIPTIKMQNSRSISYEGEVKVTDGSIPFKLYNNGEQLIAEIEGAKKPIVFHSSGILLGQANMSSNMVLDMLMKPVMEQSDKVMPLIAGLIADVSENPAVISVNSVTESVNQQSFSLKKLHMELKGNELGVLISNLLTNLTTDEKAMKEFLGALYEVVKPSLKKSLEDAGNTLLVGFIDNKDFVVSFIFDYLKGELDKAKDKFSATLQEKAGKGIYSDNAYLKADLYLDNELMMRKSALEALIPIAGSENGIGAVKLTAISEKWNVNGTVTTVPISAPSDAFKIGASGSAKLLNPTKLVNNFDKGSTAYSLLKDNLQLTRKRISMVMDENAGQDPGDSGKPFIKNNSTLVPARFVSETLDADIAWDGGLRQVTIKDEWSGTTIVLTIDSKIAIVNSKEVELETEAMITGGSTYVPVRFIAENLGGKVGWDADTRTVSIERD